MRILTSNSTLSPELLQTNPQRQSPSLYPSRYRSNLATLLAAAATPNHAAELHGLLITSSSLCHPFLHSLLVSLYVRCSRLLSATATLLSIPSVATADYRNTVSIAACTAVLARLSRSPRPDDAIFLFSLLRFRGILLHPNPFIFSATLLACRSSYSVSQLHSLAFKHGATHDLFVSSSLTDMYAKSSDMDTAKHVFDEMPRRNLVSWNALVVGYLHNRLFLNAILAFRELLRLEEDLYMKPDQVTFSSALSACANSGELSFGLGVHCLASKAVLDSLPYVKNSLISMYSKCGRLDDARKLFNFLSEKDAVTWNIMIAGLLQGEDFDAACWLLLSMRRLGIEPDEASFSTVLHASANVAELLLGAEIHCQALKVGLTENSCIISSLINMYSKCGSLENAQLAFSESRDRLNVVSWTAMIMALQQHGHVDRVLQMFDEMVRAGLEPGYITFVCVLSACSHAGLVEKGFEYLSSMSRDHNKMPGNEHYACMVDMLGRAGRLDDARRLIEEMPIKPEASVWGALLGACRNWRNLEMGKEAAFKLLEMEPGNPGNYVLLYNLHAAHGETEEAGRVWRLMEINCVKKETSCSWTEVGGKTFVFTVHDRSHERTEEIYETLGKLEELVKEEGYVAEISC